MIVYGDFDAPSSEYADVRSCVSEPRQIHYFLRSTAKKGPVKVTSLHSMPMFGFSFEFCAAWAHIDWTRILQGLHYKTGRSGLTALVE